MAGPEGPTVKKKRKHSLQVEESAVNKRAGGSDGGRGKKRRRGRGASGGAGPTDLGSAQSAAELEAWGLDRLSLELTLRGLKTGGSLKDRATRLFASRDTPWAQWKPRDWSSMAKRCVEAVAAECGSPAEGRIERGRLVLVHWDSKMVFSGTALRKDGKPLPVGHVDSGGALHVEWHEEGGTEGARKDVESARSQKRKGVAGAQAALGSGGPSVEAATAADEEASAPAVRFPFETEADDHCESPFEAYRDVATVLDVIAAALGKTRADLRIYDPYYCSGRVVEHLASLGFLQVYNKCEDFYAVVAEGRVPEYDALVTNPPYSRDHLERIVQFCVTQDKPWLLLLPNFVYQKDFYMRLTDAERPAYLAPRKRYTYWTPKALKRGKHTHTGTMGERTSPFVSFWYLGLKKLRKRVVKEWGSSHSTCALAPDAAALPHGVMDVNDPNRKRAKNAAKEERRRLRKEGAGADRVRGVGRESGGGVAD